MLKKSFLSHFEQIYRSVSWLTGNEQFIEGTGFIIQWGLSHSWYKLLLREEYACSYGIMSA